jgi:aminoglycoside 2'-N-acetyltransferase I
MSNRMNDKQPLTVRVVDQASLSEAQRRDIVTLCTLAYEEDFEGLFKSFPGATHVLGYLGEALVSHALWVTRWLAPGDMEPLRTAYVEAVATHPHHQRRGLATHVMQALADGIRSFQLGALCPNQDVIGLYRQLGWESWQGPLFIRAEGGLMPTVDEVVMILRLPQTPPLDLKASLSAEWREGELW